MQLVWGVPAKMVGSVSAIVLGFDCGDPAKMFGREPAIGLVWGDPAKTITRR
jgi:hypothetical protein